MIHMNRYARMVGMEPQELELFTELWPIIHGKKSPAGTEDTNAQLNPIITFSEAVSIDEHLSKVD